MPVIVWLLGVLGYAALYLAMARHRKSLRLSPISVRRELIYRSTGFTMLVASLLLAIGAYDDTSNAILTWFAVLTFGALVFVGVDTIQKLRY